MRKLTIMILVCLLTPVFLSSNSSYDSQIFVEIELPELYVDPVDLRAQQLFDVDLGLLGAARYVAEKHNTPVALVYALIQKESNWDPKAVSPKNSNGSRDYGIMQLSSSNFEMFTWKYSPRYCYTSRDLYDNLEAGIQYLCELYNRFGSWEAAVTAYNCGPGRYSTGKVPESTKMYVNDVLRYEELLNARD